MSIQIWSNSSEIGHWIANNDPDMISGQWILIMTRSGCLDYGIANNGPIKMSELWNC